MELLWPKKKKRKASLLFIIRWRLSPTFCASASLAAAPSFMLAGWRSLRGILNEAKIYKKGNDDDDSSAAKGEEEEKNSSRSIFAGGQELFFPSADDEI